MRVQFLIRRRTPLALMHYGVYVYLCSNSLRRASRILEPLVERSHEAIRQWVQRLAPICDRFDVDRSLIRIIFVDETMIRIRGREAWVWVAFEPGLRCFLAFHISYNRSILDAHTFLKGLRSRYGLKAHLDGRGALLSRGLQMAEAGASRLPDRVEEPHREDEPISEGPTGELR